MAFMSASHIIITTSSSSSVACTTRGA